MADIFEATTAERPYRPALSPEQAFELMRRDVPTRLCPDAFAALTAQPVSLAA